MMEKENRDLLIKGAKVFGIHLDEKAAEAFDIFLKELLKWNQKVNLTAVRSEKGIVLKHFLDSLSVSPYLPQNCSLLDIGSGAGFPGIPLKITQPHLEITLIDSVRKKVDFQRHIIRRLGLKGTEAIHGRVQDEGVFHDAKRKFDITISRAFSDLQTLLTLSLPFLREGGMLIAMKGEVDHEEIRLVIETEVAPYRLLKTVSLVLPSSSFRRTLLLFERT